MLLTKLTRLISFGILLLFFTETLSVKAQDSGITEVSSFGVPSLNEIQSRWKSYLVDFGEVDGTVEFQVSTGNSFKTLKIISRRQATFHALDEGYQYEVFSTLNSEKDSEKFIRTYGANKNYSFSITKRGSEAAELTEVNADLGTAELISKSEAALVVKSYLEVPFGTTIPDVSLFNLLNHNSFKLLSAKPTDKDSVLIRFDCNVESGPFRLSGPAELEIQNSNYYLPIRVSLSTQDADFKGTLECRVEYSDVISLLRQRNYISVVDLKLKSNPKEKYISKDEYSFEWRRPKDEERELLLLPTYGFPEPVVATSRYWWILAGGILFLAGIYFFVIQRK